MNPKRIAIKFAVSPKTALKLNLRDFIPLFHRFIQEGSVEGLLVDVADYAHVPEGPGIILVGHDVDYGIDETGGRPGLLTVSKRYGDAALDEVLCDTLRKALIAIAAIEADASTGLRFEIDRVEVQLLDRLVAPNTEKAFAEARAELQKVAQRLHGEGATLSRAYEDDSRHTLSAAIQSSEPADLETLIEGLGGRKAITSPAAKQVEWAISVEALKKLRDQDSEHLLVDVREAKEYEICNLGGKLIPLDTLGSRLGELDPESHIIVHCKLGGRGAKAVTLLREAGFENAWYVNGGIIAWIDRVDSSLKRY